MKSKFGGLPFSSRRLFRGWKQRRQCLVALEQEDDAFGVAGKFWRFAAGGFLGRDIGRVDRAVEFLVRLRADGSGALLNAPTTKAGLRMASALHSGAPDRPCRSRYTSPLCATSAAAKIIE